MYVLKQQKHLEKFAETCQVFVPDLFATSWVFSMHLFLTRMSFHTKIWISDSQVPATLGE